MLLLILTLRKCCEGDFDVVPGIFLLLSLYVVLICIVGRAFLIQNPDMENRLEGEVLVNPESNYISTSSL